MASARDALWESGYDESVEVNQRALIDKVLARYSGEFTVFREMLQNSDDANASAVEIHFQTNAYVDRKKSKLESSEQHSISPEEDGLPDLKTMAVHRWTFKNNGIVFRDEDWSRLKKIADGNPDEEKIGAFGVGFYSLFSVTEEPWVLSGDQWMNFYWKDKKDQLFARRGARPDIGDDPWTTFQMDLRDPAPIPPPFDFTRFLASSLTFMRHLLDVSVFLDDKRLSRLTKVLGTPQALNIPRGLKPSSPLNMMVVKGIQTTPLSIKAEVMQWVYMAGTEKPRPKAPPPRPATGGGFFSSLFTSLTGSGVPSRAATPLPAPSPVPRVDPKTIAESNVVLSIFTAEVLVNLDKKMTTELNRSTKKNPPTKTKYELIYTGKDDYDASRTEDEKQGRVTGSVFQGLRADIEGTGLAKVFIGHSTGQTTGMGGHMSARFIPTVERESIDLMDRNIAVWNKELLYVGGFLARAAYEVEIETIQQLWNRALELARASGPAKTVEPQLQAMLRGRAIHALKFFTFHPSTPAELVSSLLEDAFFACAARTSIFSGPKAPFSIMSTVGVRDASEVRYPDASFSGFVKDLAVIPDEILKQAKKMVDALRARGLLKEITFLDVLHELRNRPLNETEMIACFKWWIDIYTQHNVEDIHHICTQLLNSAVLFIEETDNKAGQIVPLSVIESFLNSRGAGALIPTDSPLPPHLLPVSVSRHFDPASLEAAFNWRELSIVDWLRHITKPPAPHDAEYDLDVSAQWAERVLQVLSRASQSLPRSRLEEIAAILKDHTCIPTSKGLKKPDDAYFQNAHVFHDLPVVTLPSGIVVKGAMEKLLQTIGVKKHVDLQIIFDRMVKTGDWTIAELIKYLVAVQSTLTPVDFKQLNTTSAFPRERREGETLLESGKLPRQMASELYEPLDAFRVLKLPVIDWGTHPKWRGNSDEAKFLFRIGLRRCPPLGELLGLAASADVTVRAAALKYFFDNYATRYSDYDPNDFLNVAFVPAVNGATSCLAKPPEVFSSPEWAALGFTVADPSLKGESLTRLKLQEHPPGTRLVGLLKSSPPPTEDIARQWFATLAIRVIAFSPTELMALSQTPIVPVKMSTGVIRHQPPTQCYFKGDSQAQFHSKLFTFVDFGAAANTFLSACGVRHEPSVEEVAKILLDNPRQFYQLAQGRENYLTELRNIAVNRRLVSSGTMTRMKRSSVLLGFRRVQKGKAIAEKKQRDDTVGDLEEDDWEYQDDLLTPDKIVIADETNAYRLFGDAIFTAPQEDLLEDFYMSLGCRRLSSMVREDLRTSNEVIGSQKAAETRALILERLPLFLHEHTHAETRVSFSWLNTPKNFVVKTFGKLTVMKTLQSGGQHASKSQDASAVARRLGRGPIELWLAGNDQVDMYEVSTSMCRLLFDSPKVNDALLFMTILSTDLRALRRRGYNVDRILRQQKANKLAAEEAARANSNDLNALATLATQLPAVEARQKLPSPPTEALVPLGRDETRVGSLPGKEALIDDETPSLPKRPSKTGSGPMSTVRNFISRKQKGNDATSILGPDDAHTPPPKELADSYSEPQLPLLPLPRPDRSRTPNPHATPKATIASNIELAVRACKEEQAETLSTRQHMEAVKESLHEGCCDISRDPNDMKCICEMGGIKVYVSKDVTDAQRLMNAKKASLARFIHTIRPLQEVYTLPPTSLHIFYDRAGELIAFNRNASLFLNLRYFEQWHDAEVQQGNLTNAYTSWYFTLAHEIAHNLVQPHNSEHEFYFSSICEAYLPAFMRLLTGQ